MQRVTADGVRSVWELPTPESAFRELVTSRSRQGSARLALWIQAQLISASVAELPDDVASGIYLVIALNRQSDQRSDVAPGLLLRLEFFNSPAYDFSCVNRAVRANRDFVRVEMRSLTWWGSGEAADDFAPRVDL